MTTKMVERFNKLCLKYEITFALQYEIFTEPNCSFVFYTSSIFVCDS